MNLINYSSPVNISHTCNIQEMLYLIVSFIRGLDSDIGKYKEKSLFQNLLLYIDLYFIYLKELQSRFEEGQVNLKNLYAIE